MNNRKNKDHHKEEEKPQILPQKRQREDGDDDLSLAHMDSYAQVEVHSAGSAPNQHQNHGSIGTSNSVLMTEYLREILTGKKPQIEDSDNDLSFVRMFDSYNAQVEVHSPGLAPNQYQDHRSIGTSNSVPMTEYLREILTEEKPQIEQNDDDLSFVRMLDSRNVQVEVHSPGLAPYQPQRDEPIDTNNSVPMAKYLQETMTDEETQIEANNDDLSSVLVLDSYNLLAEGHSASLAPNQQHNHGTIDTRNSVLMTEYPQETSRMKKRQIEGDDDLSCVRMLNSYNAQVEVHSSGETIADYNKQENSTLTVPDTTELSIENYSSPFRMIEEHLNSSALEEEEEEASAAGYQWQDYGLLDIISCPAAEEPVSQPLASVSQDEDDPRLSITMEEFLNLFSTEDEEDFTLLHNPAQEESDFLLLQNTVEVEALPHEEKHESRDAVAEFSIEEWVTEMEDQNWIEKTTLE